MPSSTRHPGVNFQKAPPLLSGPIRTMERIHSLELILVTLVALNLGFLPWAFGGVDVWSQLASAGLALGAIVVALLPRLPVDGAVVHLERWPRLRRFPVFWAGLVLFAYMIVQALNPAFDYQSEGTTWWLVPLDHAGWLPAGMRVPFDDMSIWRSLVIWGSCWLTVCALWTGITHRRSILWLLMALSVNAFVFAAFGLVQRASGTVEVYWTRPVGFPYFFAAIIYKNHASAFFGLLAFVTIGLTIRAFWQSRRHRERSNPGIILLLFALILMLAIALSFSFSGMILFGAGLLLVMPVTLWRYAKAFPRSRSRIPVLLTVSLLLLLTAGLGAASGYADLRDKVHALMAGDGRHSARERWLAARGGWKMFEDRWATGWGAGCFRYGFTKYQHEEPELTRWRQLRLRWEHVHDDWLELLIEFGVIGSLPVVFMMAYWFRQIVRLHLWRKPAICPILCGLGILCLNGLFDFPFHNPAVAATAGALLPLITRWGELDESTSA
ncbi:MAG TPA: O-antigen ligase family protein [Opitutaceae bacterium]|jgi:hypothetical protein|nr:O-antigen ligase family protein [Opitutaceae bacterium]